jgi:DNA-directed RNA polymerase subunit omega
MLKPSIDELIDKVGNRYSLCIIAAKRARYLIDQETEDPSGEEIMEKPLSTAIDEIMKGEIEAIIPEPPKDRI